jgi:hypothetical protein
MFARCSWCVRSPERAQTVSEGLYEILIGISLAPKSLSANRRRHDVDPDLLCHPHPRGIENHLVFAQCGAVDHFEISNNAGSTGMSTFQAEYSSLCRFTPAWYMSILVASMPPPAFT